jgi:hypothetical protein
MRRIVASSFRMGTLNATQNRESNEEAIASNLSARRD